jgi:hypothetical protein
MQLEHTNQSVKIKIEFSDDSGTKYSFNIQGSSKDNIQKLLDFAESVSSKNALPNEEQVVDTNFAKLYGLLESRFRFGSFTSNDVLKAYQQDFAQTTTHSIISTYLSRMTRRGLLNRIRQRSGWLYRLARTEEQRQQLISQPTPSNLVKLPEITP